MNVTVEGIEYAPAGDKFAMRDADQPGGGEWTDIDSLPMEAEIEFIVVNRIREDRIKSGPRQSRVFIQRSERNKALAEELGLTGGESDIPAGSRSASTNAADALASRLTDGSEFGSNKRVSDERFDAIAIELGLSPQDMRDRFAGRTE